MDGAIITASFKCIATVAEVMHIQKQKFGKCAKLPLFSNKLTNN